ncbi:hypothetical protein [Cysteiniphilum marinum]|uniref:hypothetical protein n=1 Tax=Cysteiniphilum marinum TaxID=2774191 RepID=UPI00193BF204|nr:hypothetical protein [Cysteiniphilum marinum]
MKMTKIIMSLCLVIILTGCVSKESPEAGSPAEYSLNLATESGTSVVGQLMSVNLQLNNSYNGLAIAGILNDNYLCRLTTTTIAA